VNVKAVKCRIGITLPSGNPLPYLTGSHAECVWGCLSPAQHSE